ncbi:MAG: Holliday junction resolvase RuvX [Acidobacteriota bacterium]|nr:Holliday junction resolvase RuvX [Blastocatellia bacterium]MDW8412552.1 Holliday junction resolvase RuvX [Acidobacteriota bacterium]
MAIDYGEKRLGIALSDELGWGVRPLVTLQRLPKERSFRAIAALVDEYSVARVVVGIPFRLDGSIGEAALRAMRFADELRSKVCCEVELWDEKLTSVEAEERMRAQGLKLAKRNQQIDQYAAKVLLEDYISSKGM